MMNRQIVLECRDLSAGGSFGLDHFCMEVFAGEVLLILGNCSSGKEIFRDVLIGKEIWQTGSIYWNEKYIDKKDLDSIFQFHKIIYANPDKMLIDSYSIAENIFLMRSGRLGILPSKNALYVEAESLMKELDLSMNPHTKVEKLGYFERFLVCLAKALSYESSLIIMEYIGNAFSNEQITKLQEIFKLFNDKGKSILIFGEKIEELSALGDRALIMSEGRDRKVAYVSELKKEEIAYHWLGEAYPWQEKIKMRNKAQADILGIFDKDWKGDELGTDYLKGIFADMKDELEEYSPFFDYLNSEDSCIYIENKAYDRIMAHMPLTYNLLIPRSLRELLSVIVKRREAILEQEFYEEFPFLKDNRRRYSDYFFYKLVAIYRIERFRKKVIILDNPFAQLDTMEESYMRDYIHRLAGRCKVIIISHVLQELLATTDQVIYV